MPNGGTHCCLTCSYNSANLQKEKEPRGGNHYCVIRDIGLTSPAATFCLNYSCAVESSEKEKAKPVGVLQVLDYFVAHSEITDRLTSELAEYLQNELYVSKQHAYEAAKNCIMKTAFNYELWKISINSESLLSFGLDRLVLAVYCGLEYSKEELNSLYIPNVQEVREIVYTYLCRQD